MKLLEEMLANYLFEIISAIIIALVSYWFTKLNEKAKAKNELKNQQEIFKQEKEKLKVKYDAKLKEQELNFQHEKDMLESKHQKDIEKHEKESQDQDLKCIFTGEYDMGKIMNQLEGLSELDEKAKQMEKQINSGTYKNKNHPARRK